MGEDAKDFVTTGPVVEWRGPAPFYFIELPPEDSADVKEAARGLEYWGQVPVIVRIGRTEFTTALFPRHGVYLLPVKDAVRRAEGIVLGQSIEVEFDVGRP